MALQPSQDRLYNKLMKYRNEIAEHAGIVPRGILTDNVLRRVADTKPLNESDLLDISGVSQVFVEKYGKLFIEEIRKHVAGDFEIEKLTKVARDVFRLIESDASLKEISKKMFLTEALAANYMRECAINGAPIVPELYFDMSEFNKVKEYIDANPEATFTEVKKNHETKLKEHMLKLAYAILTKR